MEKGAITGTIFDPSGAVVPGADVTVINTSTGAERVLISNEAGRFRADILPAGEYVIEISLAGFARTIVEGVVLSVGQELIEDVTLQLEAVGQESPSRVEPAAWTRARPASIPQSTTNTWRTCPSAAVTSGISPTCRRRPTPLRGCVLP